MSSYGTPKEVAAAVVSGAGATGGVAGAGATAAPAVAEVDTAALDDDDDDAGQDDIDGGSDDEALLKTATSVCVCRAWHGWLASWRLLSELVVVWYATLRAGRAVGRTRVRGCLPIV